MGSGERTVPEPCLFVVWGKGRHREEPILADLQRRFEVLSVHEITWTPGRVNENFSRFYADLPVRGVYHMLSKGPAPFLAVAVQDHEPVVEERLTSRGPRTINGRFLDAKTRYREWAGRLTIHCTETQWETDRDLIMLLGVDAEGHRRTVRQPWNGRIERITRDLTGSGGWRSESELFGVLNRSVVYVATGAATGPAILGNGVDLLTDDYHALRVILNARPREAPAQGGRFRVSIAGKWVEVGIRYVGDEYYCADWASALVASRVLGADGFFRPPDREAFEAFAYHAFLHQPQPSAEEKSRLVRWASELGVPGWTPAAVERARDVKPLLDALLARRGYSYSEPRDTTQFFNHGIAGSRWPALQRVARFLSALARRITTPLRACYWRARDQLIVVPGVRAAKRWVRG